MVNIRSTVLQRQAALRATYKDQPEQAIIVKYARTASDAGTDPFHGVVVPGTSYGVSWPYGVDRAVGGHHDAPNPAELLCTALAACEEATVRMVADVLGITQQDLVVEVVGKVDVRGSLAVDPRAPVGFKAMDCSVRLTVSPDTLPALLKRLLEEAERSCINLATLRGGVPVQVAFAVNDSSAVADLPAAR